MRALMEWTTSVCVVWMGAVALAPSHAIAQDAIPTGNVARGKILFARVGCYECHGYQGQGGGAAGPKLAPDPPPYALIAMVVRRPLDKMPVYTSKVLSDSEIADIYAYLRSIPKARAVNDIPLLR